MTETLHSTLFPGDGETAYAILDGASCEELLKKLHEFQPSHYCLYAGELEPGLDAVAPYLVELLSGDRFTEWLLAEGFGKHWGIFVRSTADLRALRKHFRTFLLVKGPDGRTLYFRYYDPRVLQTYLPTCEPSEIRQFFGPVSAYLVERDDASAVTCWQHDAGELSARQLTPEN